MRRIMIVTLAWLTIFGTGLAWAQKQVGTRRPTPVMAFSGEQKRPVMRTLSNGSLNPTAVTIISSTPDTTTSNTSTAITLQVTGNPAAFHIYVVASAATFTGCNTPPVSSVKAACGTAVGVTCAASAPLTNAAAGITLASGRGNVNNGSFNVTYTFQDSWAYSVGSSCQTILTYYYSEP